MFTTDEIVSGRQICPLCHRPCIRRKWQQLAESMQRQRRYASWSCGYYIISNQQNSKHKFSIRDFNIYISWIHAEYIKPYKNLLKVCGMTGNVLAARHNEVCGQPRTHLDVYTLLSMTILQHNHVHCGRGCHVRTRPRRNDGSDGSNDVQMHLCTTV